MFAMARQFLADLRELQRQPVSRQLLRAHFWRRCLISVTGHGALPLIQSIPSQLRCPKERATFKESIWNLKD